jgi:hypothetical protein
MPTSLTPPPKDDETECGKGAIHEYDHEFTNALRHIRLFVQNLWMVSFIVPPAVALLAGGSAIA